MWNIIFALSRKVCFLFSWLYTKTHPFLGVYLCILYKNYSSEAEPARLSSVLGLGISNITTIYILGFLFTRCSELNNRILDNEERTNEAVNVRENMPFNRTKNIP